MDDPPPVPPTPDNKPLQQRTRAGPSAPLPPSTLRRNPSRRARNQVPASIPSFPVHELSENPSPLPKPQDSPAPENLRVFLRIRPPDTATRSRPVQRGIREAKPKQTAKKKENSPCLVVNDTSSVTLVTPPSALVDPKRAKSEVYDGFSHVFPPDSTQIEVYEKVMGPLVRDFIDGKSGLLAAMGPTGSGKTHTMFGSPRNPGVVTLALQEIFSYAVGGSTPERGDSNNGRCYYFSMFEICCERGKGERIIDLSPSGSEAFLQQTMVRGLQEIMISSVVDAECLIARGMLKRATSTTNANNQSSRSQCVINIRQVLTTDVCDSAPSAVLTFIDLAGAEREKKTGNQGSKLVESGFINNTSMVFGLCLRSLMEHQKNPKKHLQKHFQNSMLTRYLRDYLEGKKRFTLILTVKQGELDYPETSCLLRQASPYMHIKFLGTEEMANPSNRKRPSVHSRLQSAKRRNCNLNTPDDIGKPRGTISQPEEEGTSQISPKEENELHSKDSHEKALSDEQCPVLPTNGGHAKLQMPRSEEIMCSFAKALWNVLKEYKEKLEVSESEVRALKENLMKESSRVLQLEKKMEHLQIRCPSSEHTFQEASSTSVDKKRSDCHPALKPSHFSGGEGAVAGDEVVLSTELSCSELHSSPAVAGDKHGKSSSNGSSPNKSVVPISKPPVPQKPRRQLVPASAMLFKDFREFDVEVENVKGTETSEKRKVLDGHRRSRGSIALLSLLQKAN